MGYDFPKVTRELRAFRSRLTCLSSSVERPIVRRRLGRIARRSDFFLILGQLGSYPVSPL